MKNEIIMASAGSGKTYKLSNRIIELLLNDVDPTKIIALTFTRKAAGEFSSALFEKLAQASSSSQVAAQICSDLGRNGEYTCEDFLGLLEDLIAALPLLNLGTLDGYFTKIVQAFKLELGLVSGSGLTILDGAELERHRSQLIAQLLFSNNLSEELLEEFLQAFKLASFGKEAVSVTSQMETFVTSWHRSFLANGKKGHWGNTSPITGGRNLKPWHEQAIGFLHFFESFLLPYAETNKTMMKTLESWKSLLVNFTGGSGKFAEFKTLMDRLMENKDALLDGCALEISFNRKTISISSSQALKLGGMLEALCDEELRVSGVRSRALWTVMCNYEALYETMSRQVGKLEFEDLKYLLGRWQESENARLQREQIDYRLDSRHDHWLLDEFQDTSQDQLNGLLPLLDEVAQDSSRNRSLFVVGDVKQAIYQWRGGDPKLFFEIAERYGVTPDNMATSWRSQSPVLSLVNHVCGNSEVMRECFEGAVDLWKWQKHVKAEQMKKKPAYSEVRTLHVGEEKEEHLIELLRKMAPTERGYSCALLLRSNKDVLRYANLLRNAGFQVAEEGRMFPALDNPTGHMLLDLLRWLSSPSDHFALQHLQMTPLGTLWPKLYSEPGAVWESWTVLIYQKGLLYTLDEILEPILLLISQFGRDRLSCIREEIRGLKGDLTMLVKHLENLSIPVADAVGVIQIMTIHQSKGLGFDVVILPEISTKSTIDSRYFKEVSIENEHGYSFLSPPSQKIRHFYPELKAAEEEWKLTQYYDAFCLLYVALTRSKLGLYCFLDALDEGKNYSVDSLSRWIEASLPSPPQIQDSREKNILYQNGDSKWYTAKGIKIQEDEQDYFHRLILPKKRGRAFSSNSTDSIKAFSGNDLLEKGIVMHRLMESIEWLPAIPPQLLKHEYWGELELLFSTPKVEELLTKSGLSCQYGEEVKLFREQTVEWIDDKGIWNTARIDRFSVCLQNGKPYAIDIIDFKYDITSQPEKLQRKYAQQLLSYREGLVQLYGSNISIKSHLINLFHHYVVSW